MRMINQAVAALLRAIGLRKEKQYDLAQQSLDQAIEQLTGFRADLFRRLDDQAILAGLIVDDNLDLQRTILLADIFEEQGKLFTDQNRPDDACTSFGRAIFLALEVTLTDPQAKPVEWETKIDDLALATLTCRLPFETQFNLYSYYESTGHYAQAEFCLRKLHSSGHHHSEILQEYQEFHQRLLAKTEAELIAGGLSQEQINSLDDQTKLK